MREALTTPAAEINDADPVEVIALAIEQCDKDFRPVGRVYKWSFDRAEYIASALRNAGHLPKPKRK